MDKLQVGFVGLRRGGGLVRALAGHPRVEVAALCDLKEDTLVTLAEDFHLSEDKLFTAFDDFVNAALDVVVIATPIEFHAAQAVAALESGKHVLCEQTVAYTLEECEAVIAAQERTGNVYMMAENYCYFHYILEWRRLVAQGTLGNLFYAEAEYVHEIADLLRDPDSGTPKWRLPRAPIWYCAHTLGPVLTLMDDRIVKATGASAGSMALISSSATYKCEPSRRVGPSRLKPSMRCLANSSFISSLRSAHLDFHVIGAYVPSDGATPVFKGSYFIEGDTGMLQQRH